MNDTQHKRRSVLCYYMLSNVLLNVIYTRCSVFGYAESHNAECLNSECLNAECQNAECRYTESFGTKLAIN